MINEGRDDLRKYLYLQNIRAEDLLVKSRKENKENIKLESLSAKMLKR